MACAGSAERYLPETVRQSLKILVVGPFGVGKTTLIRSVSEIMPLRTEEPITSASGSVDSLAGLAAKTATTVAMDFGRVTVSPGVVLYLFGTPGQRRFWRLWDGLAEGAVGALALVDTRRLAGSFEVFDELELRKDALPFAVAVNRFPGAPRHRKEELRAALDLLPQTPVTSCDARDSRSSAAALAALVRYAIAVPEGAA
jgi:signal recognition particle receptor subunit beta